ncbi:MAG: phosphomannomutase/phosphoglucomutase [Anaerolineae bacterium]|nr:phosphomannomutase/phosphoglucomutase [Anaerolineae bacterium]
MRINPDIFREFSIRGIADRDLTDDVVVKIGWAIGAFFKAKHITAVVVGRDGRNSSPRISRALVKGLLQGGVDVIDTGLVPTPVHNFATDFYQANGVGGGVMVTASHNPPEYNGLKIRAEHTLSGDDLQEIYRLTATYPQDKITEAGRVKQVDPLPDYLKRIKALAQIQPSPATKRSLKIVVDGGNGTNGQIVAGLLRDLGCEVIELYGELDGNFPHRGPDPTAPGATDDLSALVQQEKADLGLAYDGDGDRLVVVDEQGQLLLGDQIMMILARDLLRGAPAKVVYEILCTQALADDVVAHGGEPVMTPSGYAFVHQAMHDTGAGLGGELSGHLFFDEPDFRFDDAILGTIKLLNVLAQSKVSVSALVAELPAYCSSPELRVACPDEAKARVVEHIKTQFAGDYKVDTLDGARIHFEDGWALVRQSNTQPVISMRFEARSAAQLEKIQDRVQTLVEAEIKRQTPT